MLHCGLDRPKERFCYVRLWQMSMHRSQAASTGGRRWHLTTASRAHLHWVSPIQSPHPFSQTVQSRSVADHPAARFIVLTRAVRISPLPLAT